VHHSVYQYAECRYAECPSDECRYAECRYAEFRYDECRGACLSTEHLGKLKWSLS